MKKTELYAIFVILVVVIAGFVIGFIIWSRGGRIEEKAASLSVSAEYQPSWLTVYDEKDSSKMIFYGELPAKLENLSPGSYYIVVRAESQFVCPHTETIELGSGENLVINLKMKEDDSCWQAVD